MKPLIVALAFIATLSVAASAQPRGSYYDDQSPPNTNSSPASPDYGNNGY